MSHTEILVISCPNYATVFERIVKKKMTNEVIFSNRMFLVILMGAKFAGSVDRVMISLWLVSNAGKISERNFPDGKKCQ